MSKIILSILLLIGFLPLLSMAGKCDVNFKFPGLGRTRVSLYDPDRQTRVASLYGDDGVYFSGIDTPASNRLYGLIDHKGIFKPVYDIPCHDGGIYDVDDVVGNVQVNFPGLTPDYVRVFPMDDDDVVADDFAWAVDHPTDRADFTVLRGLPYTFRLADGPAHLERVVRVIRNVTIIDGLVCDVVIAKDKDETIRKIAFKTADKKETIIETEPDGTTREIHVKVLKTELVVEVHSDKKIKTILTNCTNTTVPVGGMPCNVTLTFDGLTIDNITVISLTSGNLIFEDFDVMDNITLDLVDNENYFALIFFNGCPINITFNCSTPFINITDLLIDCIPAGGMPCNVTLNFGPLTIENITVISLTTGNLIFEGFDIPNNLTLDLVDDEEYFALIFDRGCPLNLTFNCSTPFIDLSATIKIIQFSKKHIDIELICAETNTVMERVRGAHKKVVFNVLIGRYIIRIRKDKRIRRFFVDLTDGGERTFLFADDYLFPITDDIYDSFGEDYGHDDFFDYFF